MKPYKMQMVQQLQAEDFDRRQKLASSFVEMSEMNLQSLIELIMSDNNQFCLD